MMKNVLLLGANGLIGQRMIRRFLPDFKISACDLDPVYFDSSVPIENYSKLDISQRAEVKRFFSKYQPDIIINTESFRDINRCELEQKKCWDINVRGVENVIEASQEYKPLFIQISSVHVFNGNSGMYKENDPPDPVNYFGNCVLSAEKLVQKSGLEYLIARTVAVYGIGIDIREDFVSQVRSKLTQKGTVKALTDHIINPTVADELAMAVSQLVELEEFGIFHIAGSQGCSYYDFALEIARIFNLDEKRIQPVSSSEIKQEAQWAKNATFSLDKLYNTINWPPSNITDGLKKVKNQLD
jgi:dTDP-4-dehydrorhamnose reductase